MMLLLFDVSIINPDFVEIEMKINPGGGLLVRHVHGNGQYPFSIQSMSSLNRDLRRKSRDYLELSRIIHVKIFMTKRKISMYLHVSQNIWLYISK